jgi:hypothetical protein
VVLNYPADARAREDNETAGAAKRNYEEARQRLSVLAHLKKSCCQQRSEIE